MPHPTSREKSRSTELPTFNELLYGQVKDVQERIDRVEKSLDRVNIRLDRQDARMDKLEEKIDRLDEKIDETRKELNERIDRLADKIDDLHKEIKSSANHGQIANISTIGIALAVIYSLLR